MLPKALSCHLKKLLLIGEELSGKAVVSIFSFYFNATVSELLLYKGYLRVDSGMFIILADVKVNMSTRKLVLQIV